MPKKIILILKRIQTVSGTLMEKVEQLIETLSNIIDSQGLELSPEYLEKLNRLKTFQQGTLININVGGQVFSTTKNTLNKEESLLSVIADGYEHAKLDDKNAFFIDRDGTYFRYILNYLRDGRETSLPESINEKLSLLKEAEYYQIMGLQNLLRSSEMGKLEGLALHDYCYMCNVHFKELKEDPLKNMSERGYRALCKKCYAANEIKKKRETNLSGMTALITGGRVKIGYYIVLKLLRCNATVIVTTRFPVDAVSRFQKEDDFEIWKDRLHIYGLDLRHYPSLQHFIKQIQNTYKHLEIIINNAAQTIRRPAKFYQHLLEKESSTDINILNYIKNSDTKLLRTDLKDRSLISAQDLSSGPVSSALLSQIALLDEDTQYDENVLPPEQYDKYGQQVDKRGKTSWTMPIDQVSAIEMLEVQMINNIAPFILVSQLKKLLIDSPFDHKFIINVTSPEGQFTSYKSKESPHPHTNMAKAALNMMTRTCAAEMAHHQIYMNSVDTGWIDKMTPLTRQNETIEAPLNVEDGSARVLDPIFIVLETKTPLYGKLFRNYFPVPW